MNIRSDFFNNKIYDTIDPEKRTLLANELFDDESNEQLAEALDLILSYRYSFKEVRGKIEYIDNFMKIWVDIAFDAKDNLSERKINKIRAKYLKRYEKSDIVMLRNNEGEIFRDLLYCEFRHLCRVYIFSCTESKSYSRYFDLIPIKQSKLYGMIQDDLERIGITCAAKFGFDELLPEFIEAAEDELYEFQAMAEEKSNKF